MTFVVATEKLITETFESSDQRDKFAVDIKVRGLRLKPRLEARMMIYVQRNPRTCTLAHMQLNTYTPSELIATGESTPPAFGSTTTRRFARAPARRSSDHVSRKSPHSGELSTVHSDRHAAGASRAQWSGGRVR